MNRDRVVGMFLGVAIGDGLGMPVEMWSADKIKREYGRVETYLEPTGHKYHVGLKAGSTTDDTQLTLAVAEALIDEGKFDMVAMARWHVKALTENTGGWGRSTKEAVERLRDGCHWHKSGEFTEPNRGTGNGVAMKVAPLAAYLLAAKVPYVGFQNQVAELALMTHATSIAVSSGLAHVYSVATCLNQEPPEDLDVNTFVGRAVRCSGFGKEYKPDTLEDCLTDRLRKLYNHKEFKTEKIIEEFKGGCHVYESLPFSYAFFLRNPLTIDCLYDVVSAGGDADSNGSIVGSLLGALHGTEIFPSHLVVDLQDRDKILDVATRFCDKFGIE